MFLLTLLSCSTFAMAQTLVVPEGEVCRFRAGDRENPFKRWLTSQETICVPAGTPLTFPSGLWNVFSRVEGKSLSTPVLVDGAKAAEQPEWPTIPAATLIVRLPQGQSGVVYATRRAIAIPVTAERVTVPAGEALWLLLLEKRSIVAAVPIAEIAAGAERKLDALAGVTAAITWLQVPEADRASLQKADGLWSPQVHVNTKDSDPLPPLATLNGAFVFIRGITAGDATLELAGRGWLTHQRPLKIADRAITIADAPLLVRGAATLIVNWSTGVDLPPLDKALGSCSESSSAPAEFVITISSCAKPREGDDVDPATCNTFREESFIPDIGFGAFTVEQVPPGIYRAELRFGKLPPVRTFTTATAFQQRQLHLFAVYETIYGSITRGGEPLGKGVKLRFPGDGIGFAREESGEYYAVLVSMVDEDQPVDVITCDETYRAFVLTDHRAKPGSRFDLDIPDNTLTVNIIDTFTGRELPASMKFVVMSSLIPKHPVVTRTLKSGEGDNAPGQFVLHGVPVREIRLTVQHPGYQTSYLAAFMMEKSESKTIDVQLVPLRGHSGRIVSPAPFESGLVTWLSPSGVETEHADLEPDGSFFYTTEHAPEETMAVSSRSHPLWVLRAPSVARGQKLELRFPTAPARDFEVTLHDGEGRGSQYLGITIGGFLVPHGALRHHQTLRKQETFLRDGVTVLLQDIAETGPIDVLLGPLVNSISNRGRSIDPFLLPQSADAQRKRLAPGVAQIVFE